MEKTNLAAVMKLTCPLGEWADRLRISKPTLYKYIELYSMGLNDALDEKYVKIFDKIIEDAYTHYMEETKDLNCTLNDYECEISDAIKRLRSLNSELLMCEKEIRTAESDEKRMVCNQRKNELINELRKTEDKIAYLQRKTGELRKRLYENELNFGKLESTEYKPEEDEEIETEPVLETTSVAAIWNEDVIKNLCAGSAGRYTILFENTPGTRTYVDVLAKVSGEFVQVGRYDPQPGKNFVTIDDIAAELECHYQITRIDDDGKKTTGIRPMKG